MDFIYVVQGLNGTCIGFIVFKVLGSGLGDWGVKLTSGFRACWLFFGVCVEGC